MADYAITGKKGNGKTLFAVGLIRDTLRAKKRVATNLDIRPEAFGRPQCRQSFFRLPDRPTVQDLEAIGRGQDGVVEEDNGIIVLDETSTFFNTRSFGDKNRQPMLDWLVHSRKLGWDVYYICQGLGQIDKQLRESGIEYHIAVIRTDKWAIPLISSLTETLGYRVGFPKVHLGIIRQGMVNGIFCARRWYRGRDIYPAYDTQQIFVDRDHPAACGLHTVLSAYLFQGRHMSWWERTKPALVGMAISGFAVGVAVGVGGYYAVTKQTKAAEKFETADSKAVLGTIVERGASFALLADGSRHWYQQVKQTDGITYYLLDGTWYKAKK